MGSTTSMFTSSEVNLLSSYENEEKEEVCREKASPADYNDSLNAGGVMHVRIRVLDQAGGDAPLVQVSPAGFRNSCQYLLFACWPGMLACVKCLSYFLLLTWHFAILTLTKMSEAAYLWLLGLHCYSSDCCLHAFGKTLQGHWLTWDCCLAGSENGIPCIKPFCVRDNTATVHHQSKQPFIWYWTVFHFKLISWSSQRLNLRSFQISKVCLQTIPTGSGYGVWMNAKEA